MVKPMKVPEKRVCMNPFCCKEFVRYRPQNIYCCDKCQETVYNKKKDIAGQMRRLRAERRQSEA